MADEPKRNDGAKPADPQRPRIEPDQPTPNRDRRREPVTLDLKAEPAKPAPAGPPKPAGNTTEAAKPAGPAAGAAGKTDPAKPAATSSDTPAATSSTGGPADLGPPKSASAQVEPTKSASPEPEKSKPQPTKTTATAGRGPGTSSDAAASSTLPKSAPPAAVPPRSGGLAVPVLASAICAAVVALAVAYGWQVYTSQDQTIAALKEQLASLQGRLDAIDKQVAGLAPATSLTALRSDFTQKFAASDLARTQGEQASEQRLRKLESERAEISGRLEKRVGALEALTTTLGAQIDQANTKAEVVRIQAARAIEAVAKASASPPGAPIVLPPTIDVAPIKARLEQAEARLKSVETTLAKPKTEARATEVRAVVASPKADPANLAIAAQALLRAFEAGAPYPGEMATLKALGAGDRGAALEPFAAQGAPPIAVLSAQFAALRPKILAAAAPPRSRNFLDRLGQGASGLISVRPTGEAAATGTSPAARVGQIDAALARNDIGGALAAWTKLPLASQQVSQTWADQLKAREAAHQAAQALASEAVAALAKPKS